MQTPRDLSDMVVAVVGATGFVGRSVVSRLLDRGACVRALARSMDKASRVLPEHANLSIIQSTLFEPDKTLDRALDGAQAIVNPVGIIREEPDGQSFERVHMQLPRLLVEAAHAHQSRPGRIVHISALSVQENADTEYARSKFAGEQIIRHSGLDWTILRPGLIHGPGSAFMQMIRDWACGRAMPFFCMPYFARTTRLFPRPEFAPPRVEPIFVDDVASAVAACLERDISIGEVYPLVGSQSLLMPEMYAFVRDRLPLARSTIKPFAIPSNLAAYKAKASKALGIGALLPFDEGMAKMGARDCTGQSTKAHEHLDFEPIGFAKSAESYIAQMK